MENQKKPSLAAGWGLGLLAVCMTCLYPCVFLFSQNAGEARAADMLPFFLLFLATAALGLLASGLLCHSVTCGAVLTVIGMLGVINFTMVTDAIEKALPWFYSRYVLVLFGGVLLILLILFMKKRPNLTALCGIIALTFGVLCVVSVITAVPRILEVSRNQAPETENTGVTLAGEKRNVYYLLFDEYGGQDNLDFYFSFDNSPFWGDLEDRGFSVSRTSRNTESCWTDTLVPNMLGLDYVVDDSMPEKVRRSYLEDPFLAELFRENGYGINLVNHRAFLRVRGARELTENQREDNISEYLFDRSIYCKIPRVRERIEFWLFRNYRDNYAGPVQNAIDALENCWDATEGPTLTISYIQCPHAPFLFDAEGNVQDLSEGFGWYWKNRELYPQQLQYINSVILTTVDNIQREDPEAVILLFSDHGARVSLHMVEQFGGPRFDAAGETDLMQNMLCAVYVPGQRLDIEGDTAINAARKAIDAAFGTDLGTVEPRRGYVLDEIYNAKK